MSEVEDRAKDTEVEGSIGGRPTSNDATHQAVNVVDEKDGENNLKMEDGISGIDGILGKNTDEEGDSEAETLIQSPEKRRSIVDGAPSLPPPIGQSVARITSPNTIALHDNEVQSRKRKRSAENDRNRDASQDLSRRSSPLSSPVAFGASGDSDSDHQKNRKAARSEDIRTKRNGRDYSQESEPRVGGYVVRKRRPSDIVPHRRDKYNVDAAERRETRSATYSRHSDDERSPSPQPLPRRDHRRGVSTQLTSHEFGIRKRGRPPHINTRRNRSAERAASLSSDDSNSPAPPRSALSKLTSHDHDTMSPAKTGPRKWRDKNGRTFLARACNNNDLETARARLAERPEDLNWADNAGNTPLQIAALEGFVDIVQFLLEAKCDVDTRNIDRETPLIDAVENGHVEVVKLLLDHGANPRLGNAKGDEPYELVPQEDDNYEKIRALITEAKDREGKKHRAHEQVESATREGGSSRAASAASPRDSPPMGPRSPPSFASRRRTGRSESTRNDLLWQANTQENLTKLAGKGDVQGVASILNILQKAETESLIAAAKAGHEEVLQYLLGMGDPDPDPDPVRSLKPGYNTPMLAAIGRGHADVVKLLVSQSGFNPMRKYKDKTYFEWARERRGENWQQEVDILKTAYDNYATSKGRKTSSPRKTRDAEKSKPRLIHRSSSPSSQKRMSSSPTMTHKSLSSTKSSEPSPKDRRKGPESDRRKVSGGRIDPGDSSAAVASDMDQTVTVAKKAHRVRRSQSDLPPPPKMEPEAIHRRRRLVTGKEHRRNRSTAPESESDVETKEVIVVKQEERPTPTLKRARSRSSMSPEPKRTEEVDKSRLASKKRRTVLESSPDETRNSSKLSHSEILSEQQLPLPSSEAPKQSIEDVKQEDKLMEDVQSPDPVDDDNESRNIESKSQMTEGVDGDSTENTKPLEEMAEVHIVNPREQEADLETHVKAAETLHNSTDIVKDDTAQLAKEQAELEAKAEVERLAKLEIERAEAEAEAKRVEAARQAEEEEQNRIAEQKRIADQKRAEEAEARRKAEEEALLKKKEEEERQEQLRRELEDQRRQQHIETERLRRETLPIVLSKCAAMIDDNDTTVFSPGWLTKFLPLFTVRTRQLDLSTSTPEPEEKWVANFQVASLLATKDLNLREYTSFEKRACTSHERQCLWRVARNMLSFEYEANGINTSVKLAAQRENENRPKFLAMEELFWVKLSDFTDQVVHHPHLSNLNLRTQPISLASYASLAHPTQSAQTNGILSADTKLANGIHSHSTPSGKGIEQVIR